MTEKPVRLHLGCFNKKIYGFTNVDVRADVNPDLIDDAFTLKTIKNESVDLIYTSHMLEHKNRRDGQNAFCRYYEVLKDCGELYISVPDLQRVFEHYIFFKDLDKLKCFLYGSQNYAEDHHLNGWDFQTLKNDLIRVGFSIVERFDRWKIDWLAGIDDYSAAYLEPEFNRHEGHLMSLNVRAVK